MSVDRIDLNLLVSLDALLREKNVTRAADQLGVSQPALSNSLRRLREAFADPLLVRTSAGMTPTERALELQPVIREVLATVDKAVQPRSAFNPHTTRRIFHIVASDYTESTLLPAVLQQLREQAPGIALDVMTPSDVSFHDVEQGKVDLVINRFDSIPQSFHQKEIWQDSFTCLLSADHPLCEDFTLDTYLQAQHVWVSKTGMGAGVGIQPGDQQHLGWVDAALSRTGRSRRISLYTRHYQAAMRLVEQSDLIVTLPTKAAQLQAENPRVVAKPPPFDIPLIDLKMAWSPLLQHNPIHQWVRRLVVDVGRTLG